MTAIDLTQRTGNGGTSSEDRVILPTDTYRMKIIESKLEDDKWSKPNKDGSLPQKIVATFEITTLTEEQQEIAAERDEEWDAVRIWHRFNPYYGSVKAGGPSKFKEFLDNLTEWGLLTLSLEAFDPECLVGIELRCSVLQYIKTMGENAGQPGNKITGFAAVRVKNGKSKAAPAPRAAARPAPAVIDGDEDLPF